MGANAGQLIQQRLILFGDVAAPSRQGISHNFGCPAFLPQQRGDSRGERLRVVRRVLQMQRKRQEPGKPEQCRQYQKEANYKGERFHDRLAYHDFEGPAVDEGERERLVSDLGSCDAMVLRNHGLLTCGRSVAEAFLLMNRLEMACRVQIDFMGANTPLRLPTPDVMTKTARVLAPPTFSGRQGTEASLGNWNGQREWSALLRQLERTDSSYQL